MSLPTLRAGSIFAGDYRLLQLLDEGGMGAVFVAEQISTGQRRALKVMHERLSADVAMRRRFEQEARVAAKIPSDHVVQVLAAGVDRATGYPWICMELLEGATLDKRFPGAAPPGELGLLFAQLGHALGAAHGVGVVHRDLKPENVFLARSRMVGVPFLVKLLDFGIAKVMLGDEPSRTMLMGSPFWMAPEQYSGARAVSPATDVWALGLLAFRLITGRPYWRTQLDGPNNVASFLIEVSKPQLPRASERLAELGGGALPQGFDAWFSRCVAHEPALRFAGAAEATTALLPLLGASALLAAPDAAAATLPAASGPVSSSPPVTPRQLTVRFPQHSRADDIARELGADLSLDGLWLRSRSPLSPGTPVRLEVRGAGDADMASGSGVVGEGGEGRMFVRFSSLRGPLVDAMARRRAP